MSLDRLIGEVEHLVAILESRAEQEWSYDYIKDVIMKAKIERELAARNEGCLGKAHDEEPVFVLRGQDLASPMLVDLWADIAQKHGCPDSKVAEARACAQAMRDWPNRKWPD